MMEYILTFLLFIYVISAIAVALWDRIVRGTAVMSYINNTQIYTPLYNTIVAINLWSKFNPLKK